MDLRKSVDFSVCSAFYLLGQSYDYQSPYMPDRKLEVLHFLFLSLFYFKERRKIQVEYHASYFCRAFSVLMHIKAKRRFYSP